MARFYALTVSPTLFAGEWVAPSGGGDRIGTSGVTRRCGFPPRAGGSGGIQCTQDAPRLPRAMAPLLHCGGPVPAHLDQRTVSAATPNANSSPAVQVGHRHAVTPRIYEWLAPAPISCR